MKIAVNSTRSEHKKRTTGWMSKLVSK